MKNTNIFEKILQLSDLYGYKNITDFAKNGLGYKSPQKLLRLKDKSNSPSMEIILDISNKFENIDLNWLLNGTGTIEKAVTHVNSTLSEPNAVYKLKTDTLIQNQQIPLYSLEVAAGIVQLFRDQAPTKEYISIPNLPKCDGALYVNGDSMYPLLKSGDIVMYRQVQDLNNCIFVWGEMYLISFDVDGDNYSAVKYIQKSNKADCIKLVSQNKHHDDLDIQKNSIRALALVKASIRINSMM
jgi:phage repressor protein C with HTH and peptisase S24 domain